MDSEIRELKRWLRQQRCPSRVIENVRQEILRERGRPALAGTRSLRWSAAVIGALALVAWLALWSREIRTPVPVTRAVGADRARVVEEATLSLACVGRALIDAGSTTETIVKEQTVPIFNKLKERLSLYEN